MIFLVWSFEHDGWWCSRGGYCNNADKARHFDLGEALMVCLEGNRFSGWINEAIVPVHDERILRDLKSGRPTGANMPGPHIWREESDNG